MIDEPRSGWYAAVVHLFVVHPSVPRRSGVVMFLFQSRNDSDLSPRSAGRSDRRGPGSKGTPTTSVMWHLYFWPLVRMNVSLCLKAWSGFFFGLLQQHDSNWNLEPSRAPSSSSSRVSNQRGSSPRNGPTESLTAAMRCQARQQTICEMKFQGNPSFAQLADRRPAAPFL